LSRTIAPPFKPAEFDIMYGKGISNSGCLVDLGAEYNIIDKSGAWYSYNDERIGQGRENAKDFLRRIRTLPRKLKLRSSYSMPVCR